MKNKAKNTFLAVLMMGIVLALVMFMYYYSPTNEKTAQLTGTNQALSSRVDELKKFYDEMPENQARIAEMSSGVVAMLSDFPADVKEEDVIYFAISSEHLDNLRELYDSNVIPMTDRFDYGIFEDLESQNVQYASIGISPQNVLSSVGSDVVVAAQIGEMKDTISIMKRTVDYQTITDYVNLKALLQSINADPDKKTISKVNFATNEEGKLVGVLTVDFYSASGTEKEYEPKKLSEYATGVENLFVRTTIEGED